MADKESYLRMLPTGMRQPLRKLFNSGATLTNALTGNVTGNVTGNLTGDVTGDLTGDVTGDVTGTVTALSAVSSAEHSAVGCVGTGGSCATYRGTLEDGSILTEIRMDITGLGCVGTAENDVIGVVTDTPVAYIGRYVVATYGVVYKVEAICLETPGEGTATITTDINIAGNSSGTLDYDAAAGAAECDFGGMAAGGVYTVTTPALTANDYLYLTEGDTAATTGVYNAGQFIFRFYGHAALS